MCSLPIAASGGRRPAGWPPTGSRARAEWRRLLLDGEADDAAPLGPGAVVHAHVVVSEEVVHREPEERRAMAQAAVDDDLARPVGHGAARGEHAAQLVGGLERVVLVQQLAEVEVHGAGDPARPLGAVVEERRRAPALAPP